MTDLTISALSIGNTHSMSFLVVSVSAQPISFGKILEESFFLFVSSTQISHRFPADGNGHTLALTV